ncbi:cytochrome P460 family protein [Geomonas nitrogeniifigens]|uniref:Cytochrome P460 family protein n=1 Tax=Geomonas diazotrophica TaxID=2843197 RepID=A0ABX8JK45_9BACT|nr:cytochrome P460 family protein [Geomonas nitrogeniifigens]QWV98673.1 cytochrome P460 family protein [Geomonas nitrogeniifigens]
MRKKLLACVVALSVAGSVTAADRPIAPNGIALYPDYMSWKVVAPSYREDKGQIRIITGNEIAVAALKAGTKPLPDGTVLAKVAWKAEKHPSFPVATEPGDFVQVEFMVKDAKKYKDTGGWGFARFVGNNLQPYGKDKSFVAECFGCHTPVAANDYLFTKIVKTP